MTADEIRTLWIGDLQFWMDENFLYGCFAHTGEVVSAKVIRNKQTSQVEGYGFIEFVSHAAAERALQTYYNTPIPRLPDHLFRLNCASLVQEINWTIHKIILFVGDLAPDVTDYILLETFRTSYPSVKGAKVVIDRVTGRTKGYGFVRFSDESEQIRVMTEMNGVPCSTRPMRIGPAASRKGGSCQRDSYQSAASGVPNDNDPNNTTVGYMILLYMFLLDNLPKGVISEESVEGKESKQVKKDELAAELDEVVRVGLTLAPIKSFQL